jgi:L-fuconate dehydratase
MAIQIIDFDIYDLRFHTSKDNTGSDSRSTDPDYSCIYLKIITNNPNIIGIGTAFTLGRGNSAIKAVIQEQLRHIKNLYLDYIIKNFNLIWNNIINDGQLCWNGPEKGICHQANAAIINGLWDIWAKYEKKPVWKLVIDMKPVDLINILNFDFVEDAISKKDALDILTSNNYKINENIMNTLGYPAYLTCGWSGYSNSKIKDILEKSIKNGLTGFKMKVGKDINEDCKRADFIRHIIGNDKMLSMDANGSWDTTTSINNIKLLSRYNPYWIEEPTHPDDILAHTKIATEIYPIHVATGEQCSNKVMFKQYLQNKGLTILQTDIQRLAGINEWLVVMFMCKKFGAKFCLHSGGIGLTNLGVHLCMINAICVDSKIDGCYAEYVDELAEHFDNPIVLQNGNYTPPTAIGFGLEIKETSINKYKFPDGQYWKENISIVKEKGWYYN